MESSAIRELGARLRERGNELEKEFKDRDPESTGMCLKNCSFVNGNSVPDSHHDQFMFIKILGVISLSKWCEAMEAATKLGLPWRLLRDKLAPPENDSVGSDVSYRKTLEMLDTDLIVRFEILAETEHFSLKQKFQFAENCTRRVYFRRGFFVQK